jgi:hypothetical protein
MVVRTKLESYFGLTIKNKKHMPYFSTDIDVDPDEFVSFCNKREIKKLIDTLVEDGHLPDIVTSQGSKGKLGYYESEFIENLSKLGGRYYQLSKEDEELLENIFKKYL